MTFFISITQLFGFVNGYFALGLTLTADIAPS